MVDSQNFPTARLSSGVDETERVWRAGGLEPMPIRRLPDAPPSIHLLGFVAK
jgi:hypothetical protein